MSDLMLSVNSAQRTGAVLAFETWSVTSLCQQSDRLQPSTGFTACGIAIIVQDFLIRCGASIKVHNSSAGVGLCTRTRTIFPLYVTTISRNVY